MEFRLQRPVRRSVLALLALLLLLGELCALALAARSTPRTRRRKKERSGEYVPGTFLVILKYLTLCVFGPAVLFFIYRYDNFSSSSQRPRFFPRSFCIPFSVVL